MTDENADQTPPFRRWLNAIGEYVVVLLAAFSELLVWNNSHPTSGGAELPIWVVPTLTVATCAALLFNRRWPIPVYGLQWAYSLIAIDDSPYRPFVCLLISLYVVARRRGIAISGTTLGLSLVPFAVDSFNAARLYGQRAFEPISFITEFAFWAVVVLATWALGRLANIADQKALASVHRRTAEADAAVLAERVRLARELHDIVAHAVSAMILQAAGAKTLVSPSDTRVRESLTAIESTGVQAMHELRHLLDLLRATNDTAEGGRGYDPQPGLAQIASLIENTREAGIRVELSTVGIPAPIGRSLDLAAYRIIQEALTNATRHGGSSSRVTIRICWTNSELDILVANYPDPEKKDRQPYSSAGESSGYGLLGLSERVASLNGHLDAGPTSNGFNLHAVLPIT